MHQELRSLEKSQKSIQKILQGLKIKNIFKPYLLWKLNTT